MSLRTLAAATAALALGAVGASAHDTTPEALQHVANAKAIARDDLATTARIYCKTSKEMDELRNLGQFAKNYEMHYMEPVKIFDNVYAMGLKTVAIYAIDTPQGIILIDGFFEDGIDSVLYPQMRKLGLDPARIRYVVVTHGHADHYGGSKLLQSRGAHVMMSAVDWDFIDKNADKPNRDMTIAEGTPFTFGGQRIDFVSIPGHTPGATGLIFQVRDHGQPHTVGIFGGSQFGDMPVGVMDTYLRSVDHFIDAARKAKVDVELASHPIGDETVPKMAVMRVMPQLRPNPLVVGQENYLRFLQVHRECMAAAAPRRAGG